MAVFSTVQYDNLLDFRAAEVLRRAKRIGLAEARSELWERVAAETPGTERERVRCMRRVALSVFRKYPLEFAVTTALGAARTLTPDWSHLSLLLWGRRHWTPSISQTLRQQGPVAALRVFAGRGFTGLAQMMALSFQWLFLIGVYVLLIAGTVGMVRPRQYLPLLLLGVPALYLWLVSAGPEAYGRFRVPMAPFICAIAGVGASWLMSSRAAVSVREAPSCPTGPDQ